MKTLYLLKSNNYLKVGICKNLANRLLDYRTHNPSYEVISVREGTDSDEYFLHKIFSKYVTRETEWMEYNTAIIEIFKNIHLNHLPPISKSPNKKRKKHVEKIIKKTKRLKDANTKYYRDGKQIYPKV